MNLGSGLPFAPHLYELRVNQLTQTGTNLKVLDNDPKRIYASILALGNPIVINPYVSIGQSGGLDGRIPVLTSNWVEFTFILHYNILQFEMYINNYPAATVFSVTEVLYNLPETRGESLDTYRKQSLADKIKSFALGYHRVGR